MTEYERKQLAHKDMIKFNEVMARDDIKCKLQDLVTKYGIDLITESLYVNNDNKPCTNFKELKKLIEIINIQNEFKELTKEYPMELTREVIVMLFQKKRGE